MEIKQAILASEGRTVMAENVASSSNFLAGVTNAELERAAGADLILFNALDLFDPQIVGIPDNIEESPVEWIKKAIGRPIGVNLEPVDIKASMNEARSEISIGRIVSPKTLKQANKLGFNFICLTGNPGTGVTNDAIKHAIELSREHFDGLIIAGKMHGAGVDEPVMNLEIAKQFVETGIDMLLVPAPYTVPYFMEQDLKEIADYVRSHNKGKSIEDKVLLLTANGTSQDSSDSDTIKKIALASKACGADIQHIGDSLNGICLPENIFALGQAIRGYRHQMVMLGKSNLR
ncbi:PEP phosphonomutase [Enterococcus faecalis]|nr:PEP phosphonomutase [Enterococcus faecalis]OSH25995.1 PEP phosphonomutase [Enterococcus faecalis]OSH42765.1 PEP phosphonomutase [Enterococcus faecalis]